jgi:hypothetical protein
MSHGINNTWETKWHVDTGDKHHLTNDVNTLNLQKDDYNGADNVQVRNRQGLKFQKLDLQNFQLLLVLFLTNSFLFLKYKRI